MSDYVFCIPSYKRPEKQKTLDLLEALNVPKESIYVSTQSEEELEAYERAGVADRVCELLMRGGLVRRIIAIHYLTISRRGRRSFS